MAYISLEHVVKRYQMGEVVITAVRDISFEIEKGEFCIIVGYFLLADKHVRYRIKDLFSPCREMVGEFLRISVPVMLSDGLLGVEENVLAIIMGHIGSQFVSANAITLVVQRISTIFITGISFSSCFIIGKTLGEGSVPRAQKQGNTFLLLGLAIGAAFAHNFGLASSAAGPTANGKVAVIIGIVVVAVIAVANTVQKKQA